MGRTLVTSTITFIKSKNEVNYVNSTKMKGNKNKYQGKEIISRRRLKPFSLISKQLARLKCLFRVHRPFDRYNCAILIV